MFTDAPFVSCPTKMGMDTKMLAQILNPQDGKCQPSASALFTVLTDKYLAQDLISSRQSSFLQYSSTIGSHPTLATSVVSSIGKLKKLTSVFIHA